MALSVIVLAGGAGTRMNSRIPKVLHPLAQKPLLSYVLDTVYKLKTKDIYVVVGHENELIKNTFATAAVKWVVQQPQLGTAHAVLQVMPELADSDKVLIISGDGPLISHGILQALLQQAEKHVLTLLLANVADPTGLGRIIRNDKGQILKIIESKDASVKELAINEIYSGVMVCEVKALRRWLAEVKPHNQQKEYYLTDIIAEAVQEKLEIGSIVTANSMEIAGVNDRIQLAKLERYLQQSQAEALMLKGVTIIDPARLDIRGNLITDKDVTLDVGVICEGDVTIGEGSHIGPYSCIRNSQIGKNVIIKSHSVIEGAQIGDDCVIGPFARLRPGAILQKQVHIGNFVEVKNSLIGSESKANHLAYLGDAIIGKQVNVGAGTITCNYDGANKHQTNIGDGVFIGSNTSLIAPVEIGAYATIGAGSTISKAVPAHTLALSRSKQVDVKDWTRPKKESDEKS